MKKINENWLFETTDTTEIVDLPHDAAFFVAQRIRSNVRELEGALKRVIAHAHFTHQPISIELSDELGRISTGFNEIRDHASAWISNQAGQTKPAEASGLSQS